MFVYKMIYNNMYVCFHILNHFFVDIDINNFSYALEYKQNNLL